LVRRWITETRIPNALALGRDVSVQIVVTKVASIGATPVLSVKSSDTRGITVVRGSILERLRHVTA
jgi:hypothetical protein